ALAEQALYDGARATARETAGPFALEPGKALTKERLGLGVFLRREPVPPQELKRGENRRVLRVVNLARDCQGLVQKRGGLAVLALQMIDAYQAEDSLQREGVPIAVITAHALDGLERQRLGLRRLLHSDVHADERVEGCERDHDVVRGEPARCFQ